MLLQLIKDMDKAHLLTTAISYAKTNLKQPPTESEEQKQ